MKIKYNNSTGSRANVVVIEKQNVNTYLYLHIDPVICYANIDAVHKTARDYNSTCCTLS